MTIVNLKSTIKNLLPLTLLKPWVFLVDYKHFAFTADDFAIRTAFFDGCSDFHDQLLLI